MSRRRRQLGDPPLFIPPAPAPLQPRPAGSFAPPRRRGLFGIGWPFIIAGAAALALAIWRRKDVMATGKIIGGAIQSVLFTGAHQSNYKIGRSKPIDTIVVHTTEGSAQSAVNWFGMDHKAATGQGPSSAHYVIFPDGKIVQTVNLDDTAYHAGNTDVNARSVGIELGGKSDDPSMFTPAMMTSLVGLVRQLRSQYPIPLSWRSYPGILGHADVPDAKNPALKGGSTHHTDPGPSFPWDSFRAAIEGAPLV